MSLTCNKSTETTLFFSTEISNAILNNLKNKKYSLIKGQDLCVPEGMQDSVEELKKFFEELHSPKYGTDGMTSFNHGRAVETGHFQISPAREVTQLQGEYSFKNEAIYQNIFLKALVGATSSLLPKNDPMSSRNVLVFLSRHDQSTYPLQLHKDRFGKWVVLYNVYRSKQGIKGGEILISSSKGSLAEQLLSEPLDGYVVNNEELFHGANGLSIDKGSGAVRDVVVIQMDI